MARSGSRRAGTANCREGAEEERLADFESWLMAEGENN